MQLAKLAQSDVYWDKIISIEPDGEAEVYDLTVDEFHNFVAGDIHCSQLELSKTVDIVMFIYRDDLYNQESERKNIADITIAKHGNGPVGEISLYFKPARPAFEILSLTHQRNNWIKGMTLFAGFPSGKNPYVPVQKFLRSYYQRLRIPLN